MRSVYRTVLVLVCISACSASLFTPNVVARRPFEVAGDYDKCIELLEKILVETGEISQAILNHDYTKLIPLVLQMAQNLYEDIKCFKNPENGVLVKQVVRALTTASISSDSCVMDHLMTAMGHFETLMGDIVHHRTEDTKAQLQIILQEIQAAENCPK